MARLAHYLPDPLLWALGRLNTVVTRVVTGVLFGKFAGDWIAYHLTQMFGTPEGLRYGLFLAIVLVAVWEDIQSAVNQRDAAAGEAVEDATDDDST